MSWNYRLVATYFDDDKYKDFVKVGVHEVHYDDQGNPNSYTMKPIELSRDFELSDNDPILDDMLEMLELISKAYSKPILDSKNFPKIFT